MPPRDLRGQKIPISSKKLLTEEYRTISILGLNISNLYKTVNRELCLHAEELKSRSFKRYLIADLVKDRFLFDADIH